MSAAAQPDAWPRHGGPHQVCLGLGANIAPEKNLPRAVELLREAVIVAAVSTAWETPAVGMEAPDFLNAAVLAWTDLAPAELKSMVIRPLESRLGRVRTENKNAPRPIDIDILIYDGEVLDPQLYTLAFLAVPVAELLPDFICPPCDERLADAAQRLAGETPITARPEVLAGSVE